MQKIGWIITQCALLVLLVGLILGIVVASSDSLNNVFEAHGKNTLEVQIYGHVVVAGVLGIAICALSNIGGTKYQLVGETMGLVIGIVMIPTIFLTGWFIGIFSISAGVLLIIGGSLYIIGFRQSVDIA